MRRVTPSQLGPVLRGLSDLAGDDFSVILKKLTLDGFRALVRRSATDTGYLRSNWSVQVDGIPPETPLENPRTGTHGRPAEPGVNVEIGSKITLYNNTSYAIYLEDAPPGRTSQPMVRPVRAMLENQAKRLSAELTRRNYDV